MKSSRLLSVCFTSLVLLLSIKADAEPISGYEFIKPETRAMQDDDFANPGLLTVEHGEELFNESQPASNKSCSSCHGDSGEGLEAKHIARYPLYDSETKSIITLQNRINTCRSNIAEKVLDTDHPDLVALESFVRNLAVGEKVNVQTEGAIAEILKQGKKLYTTRYGLIDMSCSHCHDLYTGSMIRGQKISQGQANGFPVYRLATGEVTSLQQRIQQCMTLLRAEPFETDSEEIKALGLYIMSRSNGLMIETPAVRY